MTETQSQNDKYQWKIKKVLGENDVALHRMFKFTRIEAEYIFCNINNDKVNKAKEGGDVKIKMVDLDTLTHHELSLRKVKSGNVFGFKLGWLSHFVVRRKLRVGDEIGIYVDPNTSVFYFSVLSV
uniref:B3 domain-containing protein n=2 Tax=Cannabis sativa TaxID=3483 RepID=A0A803PW42_CANSA